MFSERWMSSAASTHWPMPESSRCSTSPTSRGPRWWLPTSPGSSPRSGRWCQTLASTPYPPHYLSDVGSQCTQSPGLTLDVADWRTGFLRAPVRLCGERLKFNWDCSDMWAILPRSTPYLRERRTTTGGGMPKPADGGTLSGSEASCAAVPVDVEGKQRSAVTAWRPSCAATSGHCGQTDVLNDSSRLFQRLARDGAHQADGEGRRVELGRGDRAAHRRCGVGTECAHDRVHDAYCGARSDQARASITGLTRSRREGGDHPLVRNSPSPRRPVTSPAGPTSPSRQRQVSSRPASTKGRSLRERAASRPLPSSTSATPNWPGTERATRWVQTRNTRPRRKTAWRG